MSLLDGASKTPLPSMSWDSVVEHGGSESATDSDAERPPPPVARAAEPVAPAPPQPVAPAAITFTTESIESDLTSPLRLDASAAPATPAPAADPEPAPPATPPLSDPSFSFAPVNIAVPSPTQPSAVRPARLEEPDLDPDAESPTRAAAPAAAESDAVLKIVEATPIPPLTAEEQAEVAASNTGDVPVSATPAPSSPAAAPAPAIPAPAVVPAQPAALSLPIQTRAAPTPAGYNPLGFDMSAQPSSTPRRQRKSGNGAGIILVLLLLAGLVAAGIVFGRPYLFPDEWDASAKAYAEDIAEIRGVEFVEPLVVVAEPTEAYRTRVGDQLLGDWEAQMPMWRSLGLAAGGTEREVLDSLIVDRSPAIYSTLDGQVYHDAALPAVDLDPEVTLAMAIAALDQDYVFTQSSASRSLLDEAMTNAHVMQQATEIQQLSNAPTAIRAGDDAPLAFLPPVLDYELVAPTVFSELLSPTNDIGPNPLDGIGRSGPGPLSSSLLDLAPPAPLAEGETLVSEYRSMDRGFWYLVFASHVDAQTARRMSNELSAASVGEVGIAGSRCFSSTFQTSTADGVALLSNNLVAWVGAAAPELQAATTPVDATTVQLRTCDPGDEFTSLARFGVARDLIAWEAAELATITGVIEAGGTDTEIDAALSRLADSNGTAPVLALDPTASSTDVATAARSAVAPILDSLIVPNAPPAEG